LATLNPIGAFAQGRISSGLGFKLPPLTVLIPAILVGLAMLVPVAYLVLRSASAGEEVWDVLFRFRTVQTIGRTALLIATVTGVSALIAVPMAWLTSRTDLPFKGAWTLLAALPLVIPSFVGAFLFISVMGPRGLAQQALGSLFGVERLPDIHGLVGATFVLALLSYPYLFLTVRGAINNLDSSAEEAARGLGHSALSTFWRVTLPQLRPSIAAGSLLVGLYTLSDFGAVSLMRFPTFTWVIFQQYESALDRSLAAMFSLILVAMAVVVLLTEVYTRGRRKYFRSGSGAARDHRVQKLGAWKLPAILFLGTISILALAMPTGVLVFWLVRGVAAGEPLLLLWQATHSSVLVSALAALVTVLLAIPVAALVVRYPSLLSRLMEPISYVGYALPGVVVALALVFFGVRYARPIYQTTWLLVFAYAVLFFPVALASVRSSLLQINPRLEDAARGLGYTQLGVLIRVTVPLMRSGLIMGAAMVFLLTMKELPATLILGPLGFNSLATEIWSASSEALFARAAAPALLLILISSVPMGFLVIRERGLRA